MPDCLLIDAFSNMHFLLYNCLIILNISALVLISNFFQHSSNFFLTYNFLAYNATFIKIGRRKMIVKGSSKKHFC